MNISKTLKLGGEIELNRMGFGAMRITGPDIFGKPENPQNSIDVLQRAVELGVNFIDTADLYGPFVSEQLIAEALHPYPENLTIGTKGGAVRFGPGRQGKFDGTPQHLHDALNGSLNRLKLEQITLYQLHRIDPDVPMEITFQFLQDAQKEGRIKYVGLSEVTVEDIKKAQEYFQVASVQNRFNIFDRASESVLNYCREQNIVFLPWFPIGGGSINETSVIQQIADQKGASIHQIALSWLLHCAENILVIPGTSSITHLEENVQAAQIELSENEMAQLNNLAK